MEWVTVDEAARITGMHKVSIYRMAARLEGTKHTRKEGRRRLFDRQYLEAQRGPLQTPTDPQRPPNPAAGSTYPLDYVVRLEARMDALDAERREDRERMDAERMRWHNTLNQLSDTIRELEARTSDLVALNARFQLQRPKPQEAPVYVEELPQERAPEPEPEPAEGEPRADLVAWLRAVCSK
jgi:hypothetical protein